MIPLPDSPDDIEVIRDFCRQASTAAFADLIRANGGRQVAVHQSPELPLSAPVRGSDAPRTVTVRPVPIEPLSPPLGWWQVHWPQVAITAAVTGSVCLLAWLVLRLLGDAARALGDAVSSAVPTMLIIGVIAVLIGLLGGRGKGGGRTFSGTFSGRMH